MLLKPSYIRFPKATAAAGFATPAHSARLKITRYRRKHSPLAFCNMLNPDLDPVETIDKTPFSLKTITLP